MATSKGVGIVTLTGNKNYGNRLQNYALQEVLRREGIGRVMTILNTPRLPLTGSAFSRGMNRLRSGGPLSVAPAVMNRVLRGIRKQPAETVPFLGEQRERAIARFVDARIDQTAVDYTDPTSVTGLADQFDYFVVGSDQVWNPFTGFPQHLRFLEFASPHQRVSYAASIAVPRVPRRYVEAYRRGLRGMASISVREHLAAELVERLVGRVAPVVLDPTLLLDSAEWADLAITPDSLADGGYVAEFLLSSSKPLESAVLDSHTTREGLMRVNLRNDQQQDLVNMGPLEYIGAIKNASLLITDSYHAAVFAVLFQVPFLLMSRGAMNSRLDSLLRICGLTRPRWATHDDLLASLDIDWESVRDKLSYERQRSRHVLSSALTPRR